MAAPQYNTEQLIANIKRRCAVPTSQLTYTNSDFTILANDQLQDYVAPLLMSCREEYFVTYVDVSTPADGVIPFPQEAIGCKARSICYVQQSSPLVLVNLPRIDLDIVAGVGFASLNTLAGFYVLGSDIVLFPASSVPVGTTLRIFYYKRNLFLAPPDEYAQVVSIDVGSNTIQLDSLPTNFEDGMALNSVSSVPNFAVTNSEMIIDTISSPSIVVDTVEGLEVGDYITEQGYSAIPQIPIEAHAYLSQLTAVQALIGLAAKSQADTAMAVAKEQREALLIMVSQRVDGSVKKIMNPNGGLRIWSGLGRWGRGRY